MRRDEAQALIGKRVSAWTAMNGVYVGTLASIDGKPWRGTVLITSVAKPAAIEFARGDRQRRGFRPGEVITVGGSSIQAADEEAHTTYLQALEASERGLRESYEKVGAAATGSRAIEYTLDHYRKQIERERQGPPPPRDR